MNGITYGNVSTQNKVLKNTYMLLALTLLPTIIGAFLGMQIPYATYAAHPIIFLLVSLGVTIGLIFLAAKNKDNAMGIVFTLLFTAAMGFTLAPTLQFTLKLSHGMVIIMQAAGLTSFALFACAAYVTISKKDFSFLGSFLYTSLWVLIGASIIGIFFHTPMLQLIISIAAVLIFTAYLLYDLSRIVNGGETNYVMATISIYLDLINIFTALLRILGILSSDD